MQIPSARPLPSRAVSVLDAGRLVTCSAPSAMKHDARQLQTIPLAQVVVQNSELHWPALSEVEHLRERVRKREVRSEKAL